MCNPLWTRIQGSKPGLRRIFCRVLSQLEAGQHKPSIMNISFFSTVSAIALAGVCFTLTPSSASAHERGRGVCHPAPRGGRCLARLPHGCQSVRYRGERCWFGGGHYYRCSPLGGYVIIT